MSKRVIAKVSGKQYELSEGKVFRTFRLDGESGDDYVIDRVLLAYGEDGEAVEIGKPFLDGAEVTCEILAQKKGPKLRVHKYKPKTRQKSTYGHRDHLTYLRVKDISV